MGKEKVILAYSGGLDTTAIIPWLKETYNFDVVCVCIDVGQESELEGLDERAKYSGAEKLYILDVVDEFCDEYILPGVKANATYEYEYLLGTSFARPLIAKKLVEIARKEGATTICHGATGKGNDQYFSENVVRIPFRQEIMSDGSAMFREAGMPTAYRFPHRRYHLCVRWYYGSPWRYGCGDSLRGSPSYPEDDYQ